LTATCGAVEPKYLTGSGGVTLAFQTTPWQNVYNETEINYFTFIRAFVTFSKRLQATALIDHNERLQRPVLLTTDNGASTLIAAIRSHIFLNDRTWAHQLMNATWSVVFSAMKILCLGHHTVWQEPAKRLEGYSASIFRHQGSPTSWHPQTTLHCITAQNATIVTKKPIREVYFYFDNWSSGLQKDNRYLIWTTLLSHFKGDTTR